MTTPTNICNRENLTLLFNFCSFAFSFLCIIYVEYKKTQDCNADMSFDKIFDIINLFLK